MDNPPPYDGPWPNEKELILEKAEATLLSKPTKPIPIKAVCVFHLTQPAHTDPQTGITHPIKIVKIKRATLTFDSNTTLAQFFELARATFAKLFHCSGCCAPRKLPPIKTTLHPAFKQAAWEGLKRDAERMTTTGGRPKKFITWTLANWEAELQGAVASVAESKGGFVPELTLTSWFFQKQARKLTREEVREVPLLKRLACIAKGHFLR
jgi:hypothetical protein